MKLLPVTLGKVVLPLVFLLTGIAIIDPFTKKVESLGQPWAILVFESVPFLAMLLGQLALMRFLEKTAFQKLGVSLGNFVKHTFSGAVIGAVWLGLALAGFFLFANLSIGGNFSISLLHLIAYGLILYINSFMQELLVHGYAFYTVHRNYGQVTALITSAVLFLLLHPAAVESGILASGNVFGAGLVFGLILVNFNSLWAVAAAHAVWNYFGAVWLGLVPINSYPSMKLAELTGSQFMVGDANGIETGIIVSASLLIILVGLLLYKKRNTRYGNAIHTILNM